MGSTEKRSLFIATFSTEERSGWFFPGLVNFLNDVAARSLIHYTRRFLIANADKAMTPVKKPIHVEKSHNGAASVYTDSDTFTRASQLRARSM
jgi:hypothetical protein